MQTVTDRFLQAVTAGSTRLTVVDVHYSSNATSIPVATNVPVVDGSITIDRSSNTRRSGSLTIGDPTLFPKVARSSFLNPYGSEIVIRTGFKYPNNEIEMITLGVFGLEDTEGSEADGLFPKIKFFDRAKRVADFSTLAVDDGPQTFGGEFASVALKTTLEAAAPGIGLGAPQWTAQFATGLQDPMIPGGAYAGDTDRWKLAGELANSMGAEVFFGVDGNPYIQESPVITPMTGASDSVWEIKAGEAGTLIDASRKITRAETYNAVMVLGAAATDSAPQPFSVVYDLDVNSKTYWEGPFGKKLLRITNNTLTTATQCFVTATEKLKNTTGLGISIKLEAVSNPALDAGDIVKVTFLDGSSEYHLIEQITMDLVTGGMSLETRSTQYAA